MVVVWASLYMETTANNTSSNQVLTHERIGTVNPVDMPTGL